MRPARRSIDRRYPQRCCLALDCRRRLGHSRRLLEVERVLRCNPEHLAAVWALAEIDTRRGDPNRSLGIPGRTAWPRPVRALEAFLRAIRAARTPAGDRAN